MALQALKMAALSRARRVDPKAIIAQRLKRLSSISVKLKRNTKMRLSQMQDLGGCRAIVRTPKQLDALIRMYGDIAHAKARDYILSPKADGYRSAHFVVIEVTFGKIGHTSTSSLRFNFAPSFSIHGQPL